MDGTLYRRPLPADAIAFASEEGRRIFGEALADGGLDGWFPLAEQFHTQAEPSFCGLGSLVMALNALAIDPGRLWKGPWRWFGEELLDCCVPLEQVRLRGLDLDELACLARCNGASVELHRASDGIEALRRDLAIAGRGDAIAIAAYDRGVLGQTGSGHYSPIGGVHAGLDRVLVLDVARFKYPPHWVRLERLHEAMAALDPSTGRPRGWMLLRARHQPLALGLTVRCDDDAWPGVARTLAARTAEAAVATSVAELARAFLPLAARLDLREPLAAAHRDAVARSRAALRALPLHAEVERAVGPEHADLTTVVLLATLEHHPAAVREGLIAQVGDALEQGPLAPELAGLREQLAALCALEIAREGAA